MLNDIQKLKNFNCVGTMEAYFVFEGRMVQCTEEYSKHVPLLNGSPQCHPKRTLVL
jgi:hypothetical protein